MPLDAHILGKIGAKKMGSKTGCGGKSQGWSMCKFTAGKGHIGDSVNYTTSKYTITVKGDVTGTGVTGQVTGKYCF